MAKEKKEKKKTEKQKDPLTEMKELLQRTQADFENYRKQQEKRIEEIREMANKDVILQVLPVLDNFELALMNVDSKKEDFIKGIELIYSQLFGILENSGVKSIVTEKQPFNPYYHEALMKVDSDEPENTIIEEVQKGFTLHDKVIRHAKVKVSNGKASATKVADKEASPLSQNQKDEPTPTKDGLKSSTDQGVKQAQYSKNKVFNGDLDKADEDNQNNDDNKESSKKNGAENLVRDGE